MKFTKGKVLNGVSLKRIKKYQFMKINLILLLLFICNNIKIYAQLSHYEISNKEVLLSVDFRIVKDSNNCRLFLSSHVRNISSDTLLLMPINYATFISMIGEIKLGAQSFAIGSFRSQTKHLKYFYSQDTMLIENKEIYFPCFGGSINDFNKYINKIIISFNYINNSKIDLVKPYLIKKNEEDAEKYNEYLLSPEKYDENASWLILKVPFSFYGKAQ